MTNLRESLVNTLPLRRLLQAGLLFLGLNSGAQAQGFFGFGGDEQTPSLTLAPAQVAVDIPTPVQGNNLAVLLAQAGSDNSLSALKEAAARKFSDLLERKWRDRLQAFFADEEVPLVQRDGFLTMQSYLNVIVSKQLTDLKPSGDREVEWGLLELSGDFHYQLKNTSGELLHEELLKIADLRVQEKYRIETRRDGSKIEDTTDAAIERALEELVDRLQDRIEDNIEADQLREWASL
ncbi:hypothetical protein A3224_15940 [Microbulbifer thermotolerans]|uniref:ABC-type transport auxiliary lipoprotein component domain-containing protein n=1 Tax=Microbulbifer thermotolerans TaxID=252514 RepID=A0A143HQ85_MICTH|nr:hypothetical protein A3224_15940 [Microbulbifer thermotolerans]